MYSLTVFVTALFAASVSAQFTGLPACAQNCTLNGIPSSCNLDPKCICTDPGFINAITCCVAKVCDQADREATIKYADSICVPAGVTNLPTAAVCKANSTAAATSTAVATSNTVTTAASSKISSAPPPASSTPSGGITAGAKAGIGGGIAGGGLILAIVIGLVLFRRRRRAQVQRAASQRRFEKPEIDSKPLDRPNMPGITGGEPTKAELYGDMVPVSSTAASPTVPSGTTAGAAELDTRANTHEKGD